MSARFAVTEKAQLPLNRLVQLDLPLFIPSTLCLKSAGTSSVQAVLQCRDHHDGGGQRPSLNSLASGDVIVVWKLDRLGRSLAHLMQIIASLEAEAIGFRYLSEAIDTTTASGRLLFHVMGAIAEFERNLISERTAAGMAAARARGQHLGRGRKLTDEMRDGPSALLRPAR